MASQNPQASRHEPRRETTQTTDKDDAQPAHPWHGPSAKPAVRLRPAKDHPVFPDWASI